jgi:hypothetical protein
MEGVKNKPFRVVDGENVGNLVGTLMGKCKRLAGEHKRTWFDGGIPIEYAHTFHFLAQELEVLYNSIAPEHYRTWRRLYAERDSIFSDDEVEKANAERDVTGKST